MTKYQAVGNLLRNKRMAKGWSQADAGKIVGCDRMTISMIELGRKKRGNALLAYLAVMGIPAEKIFS